MKCESCEPEETVKECANESWVDANQAEVTLQDLRGICLTCEEPTTIKNAEWNCTGIKTSEGNWQLDTECVLKCKGNMVNESTSITINCVYNEATKLNEWINATTSLPAVFTGHDKECPCKTSACNCSVLIFCFSNN